MDGTQSRRAGGIGGESRIETRESQSSGSSQPATPVMPSFLQTHASPWPSTVSKALSGHVVEPADRKSAQSHPAAVGLPDAAWRELLGLMVDSDGRPGFSSTVKRCSKWLRANLADGSEATERLPWILQRLVGHLPEHHAGSFMRALGEHLAAAQDVRSLEALLNFIGDRSACPPPFGRLAVECALVAAGDAAPALAPRIAATVVRRHQRQGGDDVAECLRTIILHAAGSTARTDVKTAGAKPEADDLEPRWVQALTACGDALFAHVARSGAREMPEWTRAWLSNLRDAIAPLRPSASAEGIALCATAAITKCLRRGDIQQSGMGTRILGSVNLPSLTLRIAELAGDAEQASASVSTKWMAALPTVGPGAAGQISFALTNRYGARAGDEKSRAWPPHSTQLDTLRALADETPPTNLAAAVHGSSGAAKARKLIYSLSDHSDTVKLLLLHYVRMFHRPEGRPKGQATLAAFAFGMQEGAATRQDIQDHLKVIAMCPTLEATQIRALAFGVLATLRREPDALAAAQQAIDKLEARKLRDAAGKPVAPALRQALAIARDPFSLPGAAKSEDGSMAELSREDALAWLDLAFLVRGDAQHSLKTDIERIEQFTQQPRSLKDMMLMRAMRGRYLPADVAVFGPLHAAMLRAQSPAPDSKAASGETGPHPLWEPVPFDVCELHQVYREFEAALDLPAPSESTAATDVQKDRWRQALRCIDRAMADVETLLQPAKPEWSPAILQVLREMQARLRHCVLERTTPAVPTALEKFDHGAQQAGGEPATSQTTRDGKPDRVTAVLSSLEGLIAADGEEAARDKATVGVLRTVRDELQATLTREPFPVLELLRANADRYSAFQLMLLVQHVAPVLAQPRPGGADSDARTEAARLCYDALVAPVGKPDAAAVAVREIMSTLRKGADADMPSIEKELQRRIGQEQNAGKRTAMELAFQEASGTRQAQRR